MPKQLIFTSTPTGIQPGRSGFQVVAQHDGINSRLIQALEKESIYEFADSSQTLPVVCKHQKFEFGDERFSVLTKMQACGVDFTGRPNHIAHHLIFENDELPNCPPSALFTQWKGWRNQWGKPRYLGEWDRINYENESHPFNYSHAALPAKTWYTYTGDEGNAALPLMASQDVVTFPIPMGKEDALTWLFFESQCLIEPTEAWKTSFTNFLTENDNPLKYNWIGLSETTSIKQLSVENDVIDAFSSTNKPVTPENEWATKARNTSSIPTQSNPTKPSAISIAPIDETEESDYQQDELELQEQNQELEIQIDSEETGTLPNQHPDEDFEDIFKSDDEVVVLPEITIDENDEPFEQRSIELKRILTILIPIIAIIAIIVGVFITPHLIQGINQTLDPAPITSTPPSQAEIEQQKRAEKAQLDPDSQFASLLGEIDSIIQNGQFLRARAYLSKYRGHPERSKTKGYIKLDNWLEAQKNTLAQVNNKIAELEQQVLSEEILPHFEQDVAFLNAELEKLAKDLRPSLDQSLLDLTTRYNDWLNNVRLKTNNVPTFFIPISKENQNPRITFSDLPNQATDWMQGLDQFTNTSQIEHIQIQVSPFLGLNQFKLSATEAIALTLWKESDRSLMSYLDGQAEVIKVSSDPDQPNEVSFAWLYGEEGGNTKSTSSFPEPPLILNFLNTLTNQSLNVVMMGGVSQEMATLVEIPNSFTKYHPESYKFEILDAVLNEKLSLFILPPDQFLRMRSMDGVFQFAWDQSTSEFNLYESKSFETTVAKDIQTEISAHHKSLNELIRIRDNYDHIQFIKKTPLWTLGSEVLKGARSQPNLQNFGNFIENNPSTYFDYIRQILISFSSEYTLIRPSVIDQWLAYPKGYKAGERDSVISYRNLLLRTGKRFRPLLNKNDPTAIEEWRVFVTNIEFWLLGEHQDKMVEILMLNSDDINATHTTDIDNVRAEIIRIEGIISRLQQSLNSQSNVSGVEKVKQWIVEITSLDPNKHNIPLILFR